MVIAKNEGSYTQVVNLSIDDCAKGGGKKSFAKRYCVL